MYTAKLKYKHSFKYSHNSSSTEILALIFYFKINYYYYTDLCFHIKPQTFINYYLYVLSGLHYTHKHQNSPPPLTAMAGVDSTAVLAAVQSLLRLVRDVARTSAFGFSGDFKKDCTDLSRRIALLSYLLEEIRDFNGDLKLLNSSPDSSNWLSDLTVALQSAKKLLSVAANFDPKISPVSSSSILYNSVYL